MAFFSVFQYDYFYEDGIDLFPNQKLTKKEAELLLFKTFPDAKLELIQVEETIIIPKGKASCKKETLKDEYWVGYNIDLVDGAFLRVEKKRIK